MGLNPKLVRSDINSRLDAQMCQRLGWYEGKNPQSQCQSVVACREKTMVSL